MNREPPGSACHARSQPAVERRIDVGGIDRILHGPVRLGVMAHLARTGCADFNELRRTLDVTQGNLSPQLRKLENAGYVTVEKDHLERRPRTRITITSTGRAAIAAYAKAIITLLSPSPVNPD